MKYSHWGFQLDLLTVLTLRLPIRSPHIEATSWIPWSTHIEATGWIPSHWGYQLDASTSKVYQNTCASMHMVIRHVEMLVAGCSSLSHSSRLLPGFIQSSAEAAAPSHQTWIIIIIITKTMFMVLSSWQSHCESSPGSFDECRMAPSGRRPKTKPDDLGCESACTGCQKLHPPSPFIRSTSESRPNSIEGKNAHLQRELANDH